MRLLPMFALLAATLSAGASAYHRPAPPARYVDVEVVDRDTGRLATTYWHDGQLWLGSLHEPAVGVISLSGL